MAGVNPSPARMTAARAGALSDSMTSSSVYTSARRDDALVAPVLQRDGNIDIQSGASFSVARF